MAPDCPDYVGVVNTSNCINTQDTKYKIQDEMPGSGPLQALVSPAQSMHWVN